MVRAGTFVSSISHRHKEEPILHFFTEPNTNGKHKNAKETENKDKGTNYKQKRQGLEPQAGSVR